jgi:ankyrin repeat protein
MEQMKLINMIRDVKAMKDISPIVKVDGDDDEPMAAANHVEYLNKSIERHINSVKNEKNPLDYLDYLDYQEDVYGNTALIVAVKTGNEYVANLLIDAGADVTKKNKRNDTALFYAKNQNMSKMSDNFIHKLEGKAKEKENLKSGGKKRKTKKGKRGNKSKESRKGKKSRKERKSRKGKKV